jgi:suppressor of ftsI
MSSITASTFIRPRSSSLEVNGVPQDEDSLRDTMPILPANAAQPGSIKVIIPFTDPEIVGRFVYHCHAVDHEDKGMMGTVLAVG